uniref:ubiquitinyl hydrolase 1 n=1 Tax=Lepisosteus oculatus TaxID=7918 RepID=W5NEC4_LEPOC
QDQNFLPKFLFVSNLLKTVKIRERVPDDVVKPTPPLRIIHHLRSMHRYTLEMFRTSQFPQRFREVIQAALLDQAMQTSLEREKKLNWCREVKRLVPLRTNATHLIEGSCLKEISFRHILRIVNLILLVRKFDNGVIFEELRVRGEFAARFKIFCVKRDEFNRYAVQSKSPVNWEEEWEKVVEMASPVSSRTGLQYDSLEDIHIFVLANILRRPFIIIAADQVLRSMKSGTAFSPLHVGGIYLPLHWPPEECYKYPVVLGYDSQHFAPLITIKDSGPEIRAVPLAYPGRGVFEDLRVHFLINSEKEEKDKLIKDYLTLIEIPVQGFGYDTTHIINAARLDEGNLPEDMDLMEDYLQLVNHEYKRWRENSEPARQPRPRAAPDFSVSQLSLIEAKCATNRCAFYASVNTQPFCHECFEKQRAGGRPEVRPRSQSPLAGSEPESRGRAGSPGGTALPSPRAAPPTAPSLSLYSETHAMKCKTPGCLFTLSVELNGLCERCFGARQAGRGAPAAPRDLPPQGARCSLCQQEAFWGFNGLCPSCAQRTGSQGVALPRHQVSRLDAAQAGWAWPQLSGAVSSAEEAGPPAPGPAAQPCKKRGCQYFGTEEKLGFCTLCFLEYETNCREEPLVALQRRSPSPGQARSEAPVFQNSSRCLGHSCSHVGSSMFEGYCQKCFVKEQNERLREARQPSPALIMRATQQRDQHSPVKCSRSSCNNVTSVRGQMCPECHSRDVRGHRRGQAAEETPKQRCRTQGCDHYANQEKQGYCNECDHFKQIYRG